MMINFRNFSSHFSQFLSRIISEQGGEENVSYIYIYSFRSSLSGRMSSDTRESRLFSLGKLHSAPAIGYSISWDADIKLDRGCAVGDN